MVRPGPVQTHLRLTVGWAFKAAFLGWPGSALGPIPQRQSSSDGGIGFWLFINCCVCLLLLCDSRALSYE